MGDFDLFCSVFEVNVVTGEGGAFDCCYLFRILEILSN